VELRHLRYFVAVVQWKSYREASRHIHVAQPAISQTVAALEEELGLKLFSRAKRVTQLTPEGEVFYAEAIRTLAQAELAVETALRATTGEIGRLSVGFLGSATSVFLPELVRKFKATYPGVKLTLPRIYNESDGRGTMSGAKEWMEQLHICDRLEKRIALTTRQYLLSSGGEGVSLAEVSVDTADDPFRIIVGLAKLLGKAQSEAA
jgi:hypothetical protein